MTQITHVLERQAFIIALPGEDDQVEAKEALLEYTLNDNGVIDFRRTYVPFSHRGRGLADDLVQAGLAWAREQGYTITASCSFVQKAL